MSEGDAGAGPGEAPTVPDPGRRHGPGSAVTVPDPGVDPRPRPQRRRGQGLPPPFDSRFELGDELHGEGVGAEVYLVTERATRDIRVLRLYPDAEYDARVGDFLGDHRTPYVVTVFEHGTEEGYGYEVMEYLPGRDLLEWRRRHPSGLDTEVLTALVRQVAEALAELHEANIVHHDVKPANLVVRQSSPFEVALIDFGISEYLTTEMNHGRFGTARYMPPEFLAAGRLSPPYDWWSLGVTVLELATGSEWLPGLAPEFVWDHLSRAPVSVDKVGDPHIRLLCRGLLTRDSYDRWGAAEVQRWLAGESPEVIEGLDLRPHADEVPEPFVYLDREYRNRTVLAMDLTAGWETAADHFFHHGRDPLRRLSAWARQYPDLETGFDYGRGSADVRLLRVLRRLGPQLPPMYRQLNISNRTLGQYARMAANGERAMPEIVEQLYEHDLLPLLASGAATPGLDGGDGLEAVDGAWREQFDRWRSAVSSIRGRENGEDGDDRDDEGAERARALLGRTDRDTRRRALAMTLWAAVADDETRAEVRSTLLRHARSARLDWFTRLVRDPDRMWVAFLLRVYAQERAEERRDAAAAARERELLLARHEALLEWLRRHNRPLALAWSVAGICALTVLCALQVCVGDLAGRVPVSTVTDAWTFTVFALAIALTAESFLAWETGGRYHPRYSLLGAGLIAVGRVARTVTGRHLALLLCTSVLSVAYVLSVYVPVAAPLFVGVAVPVWVVHRLSAWDEDRREEQAASRRGALAAIGPSDR